MNRPSDDDRKLQAAFDYIKNPADWRAPIDAEIDCEDERFTDVYRACEFFTATELRLEHLGGTRFRARADGYRNGPAGP